MLDLKKINEAIEFVAKEKKIPKADLVEVIESAIKTAYKKDYGSKDENVNVKLDFEEGDFEVNVEKMIVEEVENPATEMTLAELGDDGEDFEIGDIIEIDVTDTLKDRDLEETFGRIASQAARQVIIQKMQEQEKKKVYDLFKDKKGEIVSMKVELIEGGKVIFNYNGNQVSLPKSEQVSRDQYEQGQRLYLYVSEVSNDEETGPRVVLTRKDKILVQKLFEMQVPEIEEGTVVIESIVRQPGVKTKILVSSPQGEIDPAGTLIGPKGFRVKSIMDELKGEKIDIIPLLDNSEEMIGKALTPAKVERVEISDDEETATVFVKEEERARALGRSGLNVTQASILLDININIDVAE